MSFIEIICSPWEAKDLIAESRPDPIPLTKTLISETPILSATKHTASATFEAAKGVAFLVPLNPIAPALLWAKTFPAESAKVIIVLL
jgi:hypothetical protein